MDARGWSCVESLFLPVDLEDGTLENPERERKIYALWRRFLSPKIHRDPRPSLKNKFVPKAWIAIYRPEKDLSSPSIFHI